MNNNTTRQTFSNSLVFGRGSLEIFIAFRVILRKFGILDFACCRFKGGNLLAKGRGDGLLGSRLAGEVD